MRGKAIRIDDLDDRRLDIYRQLNRANLTAVSGRFVVEGRALVERLLNSSYTADSILVSERYVDRLPENVPTDLPVWIVPASGVSQIVGFRFHRGMLACGLRRPPPPWPTALMPLVAPLTLCVCPRIIDPTNLGGVIRNSCALGVDGLLVGRGSADPFSRRVIRVSMGTVFSLPIWAQVDVPSVLEELADRYRVELVAAVLDGKAEPLECAGRRHRMAVLLGSEGHGLDVGHVQRCHRQVTLPMARQTDSLNLASASAIILYHFTRYAPIGVQTRGP